MPFEELGVGPIGAASWRGNGLLRSRPGIEVLAISVLLTQARTDHEDSRRRVHAEIPAIEESVDVGAQQQAVVDSVLALSGYGTLLVDTVAGARTGFLGG